MSEKTHDSRHVPPETVRAVVADLWALRNAKAKGFENVTRIADTFEVSQPSVTAWFGKDPGMSFPTLDKIEAKLGKDYLNRRGDALDPEAREWSMRWRALVQLARDGFDMSKAYPAVADHEFDRSRKSPSWGDVYALVRAGLESAGNRVDPSDIPRAPGPKVTKKPKRG